MEITLLANKSVGKKPAGNNSILFATFYLASCQMCTGNVHEITSISSLIAAFSNRSLQTFFHRLYNVYNL